MLRLVLWYRLRISLFWFLIIKLISRRQARINLLRSFNLKYSSYHKLIDTAWILSYYKNIDLTCTNYQELFRAGIDPNPYFDSDWYLSANPDVAAIGIDPLFHYVFYGEDEGRKPNPLFDPLYYIQKHPELKNQSGTLLANFISGSVDQSSFMTEVDNRTLFASAKSNSLRLEIELEETLRKGKVALVIPVFNNWISTERCIRAVQNSIDNQYLQIYLIDDDSTDQTKREIKRFPGVIHINTPSKLGYIKTCNFAFSQLANFEYLFLLRNSTEPLDGFVISAIEVMESRQNCSIVGSRLFFPSGRLQTCGGIVSRFGDTIQFGELDDGQEELYRVTRTVDYTILAAGLIRVSDLIAVGGFDEGYGLDGYEDIDLALKMRSIGRSIYVASDSNVINFESEINSEGKTHFSSQVVSSDKSKFTEKWNDLLSDGY